MALTKERTRECFSLSTNGKHQIIIKHEAYFFNSNNITCNIVFYMQ